jgi:toxin-antitoxin system PIN domain toxin
VQVVDANVLLYAVNKQTANHAPARAWLDDALARRRTVGFAWMVLLAFLRLSTQQGVFPNPLSPEAASKVIEEWLAQPSAVIVQPGERHRALLTGLLQGVGTAGNLVNDAHLAAVALEHGAEVVSFDGDFARFPGVRWRTPTVKTTS